MLPRSCAIDSYWWSASQNANSSRRRSAVSIHLFQRRYVATPLTGPDFALLAEAYGIRGITVTHAENARRAIDDAWRHDGCALVDFRVEREANVFPIVPQGNSIGEMVVS